MPRYRLSAMVLGFMAFLYASSAFAEVSIETSVSRSTLPVGEQLVLDIIVSNADGKIEKPRIDSVDGFTSYSQGHSQEFSMVNGQTSSRSIFSYVLVANSSGQKMIGPFAVVIGGKEYKIAPVKVDVVQGGSTSSGYTWAQSPGPASAPSPRAMASAPVGDQDIFVKAWLDKDEVYMNEPSMLTYTLFTRMSATYKGFEKEPVVTGFWVEDFPPEKTIRRTEQFLNGQRYVVADVRKLALFPTQSGVFTIDPGVLSASVELRSEDAFQSFFSSNIFGSRRQLPGAFTTEIVNKALSVDPVRLTVKALPDAGKPASFNGAVGQYDIESTIDKTEAEVGDAVTLRVKISGRGNINTVKTPKMPQMDHFKVYDSSASTNISKDKLVVEGEKIVETVFVPKKSGTYVIPSTEFSYFDPKTGSYRTLKTEAHTLKVSGTTADETAAVSPAGSSTEPDESIEPVAKEEVNFFAKDIRFIKNADDHKAMPVGLHKKPVYWAVNILWLAVFGLFSFLTLRRASGLSDSRGQRLRRSHSVARSRLKSSSRSMKEGKKDEFYAEISKAVIGYFADKFNLPEQSVTQFRIEELSKELVSAELLNKIKKLFDDMSSGRYSLQAKDSEQMSDVYQLADEVISSFEKVKMK